jgi:hypothetical protein
LLSPEAIRRVTLLHLPEVAVCHDAGLRRDPNLAGRIVIRYVIEGDGHVSAASVASSTVSDPELGACIARVVSTWLFPGVEGGGSVTINYPFNLLHPE